MATDDFWGTFRRWRRHRPFWGGLILVLSAGELFASGNMSINGLELHLGPQGFLSYLLPLMLLICGLLSWFTPAQRVFYGIIALLAALYSFIGLNLGGFFVGMVLGIVGGGLVIAWGPPRVPPGAEPGSPAPGGEPNDADPHDAERPADVDETQVIKVVGYDDRARGQQIRSATQSTSVLPGPADRPTKSGNVVQRLGKSQKAMVIALIPLAVTATVLVAGSTLPASADECPAGLPRTSASAPRPGAKAKNAAPANRKSPSVPPKRATTSHPPSDSSSSESGNDFIDGFKNFIDGVGNLFGVNNAESPSPSVSPSPSKSASKSSSASKSHAKSASALRSPSVKPSSRDDDAVPCLGNRLYGLTANPNGIPPVAEKPGLMEVSSLKMYGMSYDGVVDMPTKNGGSYEALKFSMDKAVSKPFTLTVTEPDNATTVVTSDRLVTEGTVRFYTSKFKGKLFGFIPVTFTPEHPPPPTFGLPLWFTKAKIELAYVRADDVTGKPLKVVEQR